MFSRLQALFAANRKTSRPASTYRRLAVESLETREVMAAAITAVLGADGILRVNGNDKNNAITVRQDAGQIAVAGAKINVAGRNQNKVAADAVRQIEVSGNGGNDTIRLDQGKQAITVTTLLNGGAGNDKLTGGAGTDRFVVGNDDADRVFRFSGTDQLTFARPAEVVKSAVRADGSVLVMGADYTVKSDGRVVWAGVQDFGLSSSGEVFLLGIDGKLEKQTATGRQIVSENVASFNLVGEQAQVTKQAAVAEASVLAWGDWDRYGGWFSKIKVGQNQDGRLEEFAIGNDKALWHRWQVVPDGSWSGWFSLAGGIVDIEVARHADGRLVVFAIGTNGGENYIQQTAAGSGSWSSWVSYGGWFSKLKVGQNLDGRLEEFAIGSDKALWHRWQYVPNGGWSGWVSLRGGIVDIEVARNADGRLVVFAIGTNGGENYIQQTAAGSISWGNWVSYGGWFSKIKIGQNADGRLEEFAIGSDRALWHRWQFGGGGWSTWISLGGGIVDIEVIKNSEGCLQVFAIGTDTAANTIIQSAPNSGNWGSWISLGGGIVELEVAANKNGLLELFVIGTDRAENRKKQVLAVAGAVTVASGVLIVRGTSKADRIIMSQTETDYYTWINDVFVGTHSSAGIRSVLVQAGDGDDYVDVSLVRNHFVTVSGGRGNDRLYGSYKSTMFGDDGNDSLFGYPDVTCYGGGGSDRFLLSGAGVGSSVTFIERLPDFNAREDAKVYFAAGDKGWTQSEIVQIDEGLAKLHQRTNNNRLLKLADGRWMTFERVVSLGPTIYGDNDSDETIRIADLAFRGNANQIPTWVAVIHEVGHNWDDHNEAGKFFINDFRSLSGWLTSPRDTTGLTKASGDWYYAVDKFVTDYAKTTAFEDFSETLVATFTDATNTRYKTGNAPAKLAMMNDWLNGMRT